MKVNISKFCAAVMISTEVEVEWENVCGKLKRIPMRTAGDISKNEGPSPKLLVERASNIARLSRKTEHRIRDSCQAARL